MDNKNILRIFKSPKVDEKVLGFFEKKVESGGLPGTVLGGSQISIPVLVHKNGQSKQLDITADKLAIIIKEEQGVQVELSQFTLASRRTRT